MDNFHVSEASTMYSRLRIFSAVYLNNQKWNVSVQAPPSIATDPNSNYFGYFSLSELNTFLLGGTDVLSRSLGASFRSLDVSKESKILHLASPARRLDTYTVFCTTDVRNQVALNKDVFKFW
jgi:hypothetical protein